MENNICKFNLNTSNDLICTCFVLEKTNAQYENRIHREYSINLVFSGNGELNLKGKKYHLKKGDLFFISKGDEASVSLGDMEYAYIRFHGRRASEYFERLDIGVDRCVFSVDERLIDFWRECIFMAENGNLDLLSEAVILYSLAKLEPKKKEENDIVSMVIRLMSEKFTDAAFSLSQVSQRLGYNAKYISTLFKKEKGISFTAYLCEMRIKHAIFLMEQGVVSVKNVAILSGFGDALYFSRVFREKNGKTPKEYIKELEGIKENGDF